MSYFDKKDVKNVTEFLKGKKLEKVLLGISLIEESMKNDEWVEGKGKSKKADSCFYQILPYIKSNYRTISKDLNALGWAMNSGRPFKGDLKKAIADLRDYIADEKMRFNPSDAFLQSWVNIVGKKCAAVAYLNDKIPRPVQTKIMLSPKVTKTLKEMNLDVDLSTVVPPKQVQKKRHARDEKTGELLYRKDGEKVMESYIVIVWRKGIVFNASRFTSGCQACGKWIPSFRYTPIEVFDKASGKWLGLWLGVDCGRNIFGVKNVGVDRPGFTNPKWEAAGQKNYTV